MIEKKYFKFISLDKNRYIGLNLYENQLEIFNLPDTKVETIIKLNIKGNKNENLFIKDDLILVITNLEFYILNSKTFNIITKRKLKNHIKKKEKKKSYWDKGDNVDPFIEKLENYHQFTYGGIISKDSICIIYEGNL